MANSTVSGVFGALNIPNDSLVAYREGKMAAGNQEFNEAIELFSKALAFPELPELFTARALEQRGVCYWLLGSYDAAEDDFQTAIERCDDPVLRARIQARIGDVADSRGLYSRAFNAYTIALKEGMAVGDLLAIGRARRGLGIVSRRQGNSEHALSHLSQALVTFRQLGDAMEQARVLTSIGRTRHARGEYQQAISAHGEALNILEALGDRWRTILSLNDLGECYQALYAMEHALNYHEQALEMAEQYVTGANIIKPDIQRNLGVDLIELGRGVEGLAFLRAALVGAETMGNREQVGLTLYSLTRAHLRQGNLSLAAEAVGNLSSMAEDLDSDRFRALASFVRGELLFAQGDKVAAVAELNVSILDAQTFLDRGILWKLHAAMSHVVDSEAIAAVHAQIAADFILQTAEPLQDLNLRRSFVSAAPVTAVLVAAGIEPDKLLRE